MRARAEALFASVFTSSPFPELTLVPACIYLFLRLEQYLPCTRETHPCHQPSHHCSLPGTALLKITCAYCTSLSTVFTKTLLSRIVLISKIQQKYWNWQSKQICVELATGFGYVSENRNYFIFKILPLADKISSKLTTSLRGVIFIK